MTCHRCHGLLVNDHSALLNRYDLSQFNVYMGPTLRCINCGHVEDPVVRANRLRLPMADQVSVPRSRATC